MPVSTCKEYLQVQTEGKRQVSRNTKFYNLEMIIAVGYRVKSPIGTQFRRWATEKLKEFIEKGFVLDDARLKGDDTAARHFEELLSRIRDIRASERRAYQRVREIFALSADYVEGQRETQTFFATMQNKMHFAATGHTVAEIVRKRADAETPNMGMTSWSSGRVLKKDAATAKNYLTEAEIDTLNRIVVMFLDQAEFRAMRRQDIMMRDWEMHLDKFLADTDLPVLQGSGTVPHQKAVEWAETQYKEFDDRRRSEAERLAEERYAEELNKAAEIIDNELKQKRKRKKD